MPPKGQNRFEVLFPTFDETVKRLLKDIRGPLEGLENPDPPKGAPRRPIGSVRNG